MFAWLFRGHRREAWQAEDWPESWSLHLNRNVRLTWSLNEDEIRRLQQRVKVFIHEKQWEGCEGLEITEEMKVTISALACLMLVGVDDFYFDNVRTVLIYPEAFTRRGYDGRQGKGISYRAGEAWQSGPIVLSWKDVLKGGRNRDDGQNVVIHEFAHALDGLDGEMGGNVVFPTRELAERWEAVVDRDFRELVQARNSGRRTVMDHYGATNHAEFFAVASETFFEEPIEFAREHEELYPLMVEYYQVDPAVWEREAHRRRRRRS